MCQSNAKPLVYEITEVAVVDVFGPPLSKLNYFR
jgi:hypothetical protein